MELVIRVLTKNKLKFTVHLIILSDAHGEYFNTIF